MADDNKLKNWHILLFFVILTFVIIIIMVVVPSLIPVHKQITTELEVLSIDPPDNYVNTTIKIGLNDFSKKNIECNCVQNLYQGDTQVVVVDNIKSDYFTIMLLLNGKWNSAIVNIRVNGTYKGTESFIIAANNSPASYNIPKDVSDQYYFRII